MSLERATQLPSAERLAMMSPKDRKPLFERLKTGMEEAIRHSRGEIALASPTKQSPWKRSTKPGTPGT